MSKDYYGILGVSKNATHDEIKKAFRKQAHQHHPDKHGGDDAKFKEINEAYQILGNEQKRAQYDQFGQSAFSGQGFGGTGMSWDDFMRQAQQGGFGGGFGGAGVNFGFDDLGDILGDLFGFGRRPGGRAQSRARRGEDIEIELSIDFKEAAFGVSRTIALDHIARCEKCSGNGAEPGTPITTCSRCRGQGVITHTQSTFLGSFQSRSVCPDCQGEGKTAKQPCSRCQGSGQEQKREKVTIKVPAGINDGQRIRLDGKGNAGIASGQAGDLYIHVHVKASTTFEREGYDIYSSVPVSIAQAVLGDSIQVETIHGPVKLKIPAGTPSGKTFRLRNKGVSHVGGSGMGDHFVAVFIDVPSKLSRKQKQLFEELRALEKKDKKWF